VPQVLPHENKRSVIKEDFTRIVASAALALRHHRDTKVHRVAMRSRQTEIGFQAHSASGACGQFSDKRAAINLAIAAFALCTTCMSLHAVQIDSTPGRMPEASWWP